GPCNGFYCDRLACEDRIMKHLSRLLSRWFTLSRRTPRYLAPRRRYRYVPQLEILEGRALPSTIHWANEGSSSIDSDHFNANFGTNAAAARDVIRAAIYNWELAITDFNYSSGSNQFQVTISAADLGSSLASVAITNIDASGKPTAATITLDNNAAGWGW